jgi:hypothetical protein
MNFMNVVTGEQESENYANVPAALVAFRGHITC